MSLKEQMLKAGLITEQQAKRATHSQKVDSKKTGRKERERQSEQTRREQEAARQAERERDKAREAGRGAERGREESERQSGHRHRSAVSAPYREGLIEKWEGPRRYYYLRDGRVDYLLVSDDIARRLENGQAAIVVGEKNPGRPCLLNAGAAKKLSEAAPERIITFHGNPGG
ncbi:MAG: DUF2058 family protein [bacterium]